LLQIALVFACIFNSFVSNLQNPHALDFSEQNKTNKENSNLRADVLIPLQVWMNWSTSTHHSPAHAKIPNFIPEQVGRYVHENHIFRDSKMALGNARFTTSVQKQATEKHGANTSIFKLVCDRFRSQHSREGQNNGLRPTVDQDNSVRGSVLPSNLRGALDVGSGHSGHLGLLLKPPESHPMSKGDPLKADLPQYCKECKFHEIPPDIKEVGVKHFWEKLQPNPLGSLKGVYRADRSDTENSPNQIHANSALSIIYAYKRKREPKERDDQDKELQQ
ncbi:hypothetical protein MJT46_001722, partial [Ovis ammon polii x Ovis aries]